MKKYWKKIIILTLFFLSYYFIFNYFKAKQIYGWGYEVNYNRMLTLIFINFIFISLMFIMDFKIYKQIFKIIIIFTIILWIFVYSLQYSELQIHSIFFWLFWDLMVLITWSIIGPGLILYTLHYIEEKSEKFANAKLFGKYHVHEGFVGILFILCAIVLFLLRSFLNLQPIFHKELVFILASVQIFLFFFLYFGTFLISRDWKDVCHFKLIEVKSVSERGNINHNSTSVFTKITDEDLHFFEFSPLKVYPLGILLTGFSISAIVFGANFLPIEIFKLEYQIVIYVGYILSIIAGGMIGNDWMRLIQRFYPEIYVEIEQTLNKLKNENK